MALSVFDHDTTRHLFRGAAAARFFSVGAEREALLAGAAGRAEMQAAAGLIPADSAARIGAMLRAARPDIETLARGVARDGVIMPALLGLLRPLLDSGDRPFLHFGATSQDAIDSGLMLRLKAALSELGPAIDRIEHALARLEDRFGPRRLMGYTRMQPALPITVAHRLTAWCDPLSRLETGISRHLERDCVIQLGGAVGDLAAYGDRGPALRAALAKRLGLADAQAWHATRDRIAALGATLALVSGACAKIGTDLGLMARDGREAVFRSGGASSAMPHKQNPVAAELLVTLGHYAAAQSGLLQQSMISEMERSGAAWSLEWMVLPSLVASAFASTELTLSLLGCIENLGTEEG